MSDDDEVLDDSSRLNDELANVQRQLADQGIEREHVNKRLWHEAAAPRRLLDTLPAAAYACDANGLITYYNQEAVKLWGREPKLNDPQDRFCGSFKLYATDGTPLDHAQSWMGRALRDEREYNRQEIIIERPDGSRRFVLAHANPNHNESGNLAGAVNVLVDITERKHAEQRVTRLNAELEDLVRVRTARLKQANELLQAEIEQRKVTESKLRLRSAAMDEATDGIVITDATLPDNPVLYANNGIQQLTGYGKEELIGQSLRRLQGAGTDKRVAAEMRKAVREGRRFEGEILNYRKDGRSFWNRIHISPLFDTEGNLIHFVEIQSDVTAEKQAHDSLLETQKQLELMLSQLPAVLWTTDTDLRFTSSLGAGLTRLNLQPNQVAGVTLYDHFQTDDASCIPIAMALRAIAGESVKYRSEWESKSFKCHVEPFRDAQGRITGTIGVAIDVTELVLAENAFRKSESRLAEAQKVARIGSWEWNVVNNEVWWSSELYRIFGTSPDDFQPTYDSFMDSVVPPQDRQLIEDAIRAALARDEPYDLVHRIQRPDGSIRFLSALARLERDAEGRPLRLSGTSQDVTEQQKVQAQLRRTERLASLGTLAAGIAHEINNPLSAAWTAAETAKAVKNKPGAEQILHESLDAVGDAVRRCRVIVENVLRFARQESSEKTTQDLNDIVRRAVKTTAYFAKFHGTSIEVELADGLAQPAVNAAEIEQVLVNLIRNAVQAGHRTRVTIRSEQGDRQVHVHVADNGRGIPDADLDRIFDPFFTASDTDAGTGLGLSISHGIIEDHKGTINVDSTVGRGTTFSVTLPVSPSNLKKPPHFQRVCKGSDVSH